MSDPAEPTQEAFAARLVGDAGVKALAPGKPGAPAVYATTQPFPDVFPRVVIEPPQVIPARETLTDEVYVTSHSYASGPDAALVANKLAGAQRAAIMSSTLVVAGMRCIGQTFEGSRSVGDPDDTVGHVVSTFRFLVGPTA